MAVEIRTTTFRPYAELERYESARRAPGAHGAAAVFVGTMRDFNQGDAVRSMHLEHYPGMTERQLEQICAEAAQRFGVDDTLVVHRVGDVAPGDTIVLAAAWSAHRDAALSACRFLIEELKTRAPFWKKEQLDDRARWVDRNTPTVSADEEDAA